MSLTGPLFLDGIIALTVLAFVALIVVWHALDGRTPGRIAARVLAVLLVNVLVLLTAATQLNAKFLFFASWADIQGSLTGHLAQTRLVRGGDAAAAPTLKVRGRHAPVSTVVPKLTARVSGSGVAQFTVKGTYSHLTGMVSVQLPTGYLSPSNSTQRYPVIEAFSGYPGGTMAWLDVLKLGEVIQQQVAAGAMRPAIVVSPQIEFPRGVDTEGVNGSPGNPQVETFLTRDIPDWIGRTFRVVPDRSSWATIGYSAGGWVAAMAALLHPAQYGAAIVLGGYFRPEFGPFYEPYPMTGRLATRYDLPALVRRKPPPVAMWIETSHADDVSYASSAAFLAATKTPLSVKAVVLQNAGHRIGVWLQLLPETLTWLGANVSGFKP